MSIVHCEQLNNVGREHAERRSVLTGTSYSLPTENSVDCAEVLDYNEIEAVGLLHDLKC